MLHDDVRFGKLAYNLCRTFGAHLDVIQYPGLTAGPIIFRAFGSSCVPDWIELET